MSLGVLVLGIGSFGKVVFAVSFADKLSDSFPTSLPSLTSLCRCLAGARWGKVFFVHIPFGMKAAVVDGVNVIDGPGAKIASARLIFSENPPLCN